MKPKTLTLAGISLVIIFLVIYLVRKTDSQEQDSNSVSHKTSPAVTSIANILVNPNHVTTTSLVATTSASDVKVTTSVKDTTDDDITKAVTEAVNKIVNGANNNNTETENSNNHTKPLKRKI